MPIDLEQSLENLKLERDAIQLYDALATIEKEPARAAAFRTIAANERRHADVWATRLADLGASVPPPGGPRFRVRAIIGLARILGTHAVKDLVLALEGDEEEIYMAQAAPEVEAIAADEREHAEIWKRLSADRSAGPGGGRGEAIPAGARAAVRAGAAGHAAAAAGASAPTEIASREGWHRAGRSGTLRAVIFGVSDGLVSNLALVMGVAGAGAGAAIGEGRFILLAGIAGLLAGAFSMAAGEYVSMQSQRELFERQIELEREELAMAPEEEQRELSLIYQAKGLRKHEADMTAARLMEDPEIALDTLVREELGLDPSELGSPWGAALSSFFSFVAGAAVPVIPYLLTTGVWALVSSAVLSGLALFAVGALVSIFTARGPIISGLRMLAIGLLASLITFFVGWMLGVSVGG
jgi:VIT1/CCC1 family predicted Fe2+/Mn2+ transporter